MLILTRAEVEALLDPDKLVDALAAVMAELSAGEITEPPRAYATVDERDGLTCLLAMPGYVPSSQALIAKLTTVFPRNSAARLPVRQAVILAFDPDTGEPAALLDGTYITAARTAGCSALSTRLLAREDARTLAILGAGPQARAHALIVSRIRPFRDIRIASRSPANAQALATELAPALNAQVRAVSSTSEALADADVVCAATFSREPVIRREWISPGTHICSIGYHPAGRELDDKTVSDSFLCVESRDIALNAIPPTPDLAEPSRRGLIAPDHIGAELGELVSGMITRPADPRQITLYKSVGTTVADIAATALVLTAAQERHAATEVMLGPQLHVCECNVTGSDHASQCGFHGIDQRITFGARVPG